MFAYLEMLSFQSFPIKWQCDCSTTVIREMTEKKSCSKQPKVKNPIVLAKDGK